MSALGTFTVCAIKYLNIFRYTLVIFTIVFLTCYDSTQCSLISNVVILRLVLLTKMYFVLGFKLFVSLI